MKRLQIGEVGVFRDDGQVALLSIGSDIRVAGAVEPHVVDALSPGKNVRQPRE